MRTGGRSPASTLLLFGIEIGAWSVRPFEGHRAVLSLVEGRLKPDTTSGLPTSSGIRQIEPSVSSAASVVATNMSCTDGWDRGVTRPTPATRTHDRTIRR